MENNRTPHTDRSDPSELSWDKPWDLGGWQQQHSPQKSGSADSFLSNANYYYSSFMGKRGMVSGMSRNGSYNRIGNALNSPNSGNGNGNGNGCGGNGGIGGIGSGSGIGSSVGSGIGSCANVGRVDIHSCTIYYHSEEDVARKYQSFQNKITPKLEDIKDHDDNNNNNKNNNNNNNNNNNINNINNINNNNINNNNINSIDNNALSAIPKVCIRMCAKSESITLDTIDRNEFTPEGIEALISLLTLLAPKIVRFQWEDYLPIPNPNHILIMEENTEEKKDDWSERMYASLDRLCYIITTLPKCYEYIFYLPSDFADNKKNMFSEYLYLMLHHYYNKETSRSNAIEPFPHMRCLEITIKPPFRLESLQWLCQMLQDHSSLQRLNLTIGLSSSSSSSNSVSSPLSPTSLSPAIFDLNLEESEELAMLSLLEQLFYYLAENKSLKKLHLSIQPPSQRLKRGVKERIAATQKALMYLILKHKQLKGLTLDLSYQDSWRGIIIEDDPEEKNIKDDAGASNRGEIDINNIIDNTHGMLDIRPFLQIFDPNSVLYRQMYQEMNSKSTGLCIQRQNKIESLSIENYHHLTSTERRVQSDIINLLANIIINNPYLHKISFLTNAKIISQQLRRMEACGSNTSKSSGNNNNSHNSNECEKIKDNIDKTLENEYKAIQKWISMQTHDCGYYAFEDDTLVHTLTKAFTRNISLQNVEIFPLSFSMCTYANIGFFLKGLLLKNVHLKHLLIVLSDLNSNTNRYMDMDMSISDIQLYVPSNPTTPASAMSASSAALPKKPIRKNFHSGGSYPRTPQKGASNTSLDLNDLPPMPLGFADTAINEENDEVNDAAESPKLDIAAIQAQMRIQSISSPVLQKNDSNADKKGNNETEMDDDEIQSTKVPIESPRTSRKGTPAATNNTTTTTTTSEQANNSDSRISTKSNRRSGEFVRGTFVSTSTYGMNRESVNKRTQLNWTPLKDIFLMIDTIIANQLYYYKIFETSSYFCRKNLLGNKDLLNFIYGYLLGDIKTDKNELYVQCTIEYHQSFFYHHIYTKQNNIAEYWQNQMNIYQQECKEYQVASDDENHQSYFDHETEEETYHWQEWKKKWQRRVHMNLFLWCTAFTNNRVGLNYVLE